MNAIGKQDKKKISLQSILNLWKDKWGDIPSITITNTDNAWVFLIVSRKGRVRLSFVSNDYKKLLKHVHKLASDPTYYPQKKDNSSEYSLQIKKMRKHSKITQSTLASALGVSQTTVAEWESGAGVINYEGFLKVKEVIEVIFGKKITDSDMNVKNVIPIPKKVTIIDPALLECSESLV